MSGGCAASRQCASAAAMVPCSAGQNTCRPPMTDGCSICGAHDAKNEKLKADRGIGFEEIVFLIGQGHVLDILEHPNQQRYGGQRIFVVQRDDYVYLVPFIEDDRLVV